MPAAMTEMQVVVEALACDEAFACDGAASSAARTMLVEGLAHALSSTLEERHEHQNALVSMAAGVLVAGNKAALAESKGLREQAESVQCRKEEAQGVVAEAAGALAERELAIEAAVASLDRAEQEVKDAQVWHKQAAKVEAAATDAASALELQKAEVDGLVASIAAFEDGSSQDSPAQAVADFLTEHRAEPALVAAAVPCLQLAPAQRGAFDAETATEIGEVLAGRASALTEQLASARAHQASVAAEALGLWAIFSVAQDGAAKAAAVLAAARAAAEEAKAAEASAQQALKEQEAAFTSAMVSQTLAEERAKQMEAAAVAFERLRCPPPVVEESKSEEADVAMAAAEVRAQVKAAAIEQTQEETLDSAPMEVVA